jgi:uroporphyrin-III C-methyltransferase
LSGAPGTVWLVGSGPGDPELLTVRALRVLRSADIVLHDRLVSRDVLRLIPSGSLRIDVGKLGHGRSTSQGRINELLVRFATDGHDVVRLKGGDPFVFGRGGEEALALVAAGIPFEVVPGVTAGVAGPAFAGIPVTHRGMSRSVGFVTAHCGGSDPDPIDWRGVAGLDTIVVFMAGSAAVSVAEALMAAGRPPSSPVALIVDASLPEQLVWTADLAGLAAGPPRLPSGRPCLMVVGEVVALSERLDWFPTLLSGRVVAGSPGPRRQRSARPGRKAPASPVRP